MQAEDESGRLQWRKGWLCATGWQVFLASVAFIVGTIIQGLIILNNELYEYKAWHGTLLAIAVIGFSIIFNTSLATRLPLIEGIVLIIHMTGLFGVIIPLWVLAPRGNARRSSHFHKQRRLAHHRAICYDWSGFTFQCLAWI